MERHILIAGRTGAFTDALRSTALGLHLKSLSTMERGQENPLMAEDSQQMQEFTFWNMRSPLSARSVVIRATNLLENVDEAYVVFSSGERYRPYHEIAASDIEARVDSDIKGYLFITRELLSYFHRQHGGRLNFVMHETESAAAPVPVVAAAAAAFRETVSALFVMYQNEPVELRGFYSATDQVEDFAAHVLSSTAEPSDRTRGKWNRFSGRGGLFARLSSERQK